LYIKGILSEIPDDKLLFFRDRIDSGVDF